LVGNLTFHVGNPFLDDVPELTITDNSDAEAEYCHASENQPLPGIGTPGSAEYCEREARTRNSAKKRRPCSVLCQYVNKATRPYLTDIAAITPNVHVEFHLPRSQRCPPVTVKPLTERAG
jgi:hypothetical protein